jgi:hypothetical protein
MIRLALAGKSKLYGFYFSIPLAVMDLDEVLCELLIFDRTPARHVSIPSSELTLDWLGGRLECIRHTRSSTVLHPRGNRTIPATVLEVGHAQPTRRRPMGEG